MVLLFNKTVALLLWGDAFRPSLSHWEGGHQNCVQNSFDAQREATESLRNQIMRPMIRAGARVHVLFTFPLCDQHNLTLLLHNAVVEWLGHAHVVATAYVRTNAFEEAIREAWQLLWRHVLIHRVFDYTYLIRHDIYHEHSFDAWPPSTLLRPARGHNLSSLFGNMRLLPRRAYEFEKVLFEAPCRGCGNTCNCGLNQKLTSECGICTNDHMMWVPARYLKSVVAAANTTRFSGHHFYRRVTPLVDDLDIGFLFPPVCDADFCSDLLKDQYKSYRPVRQG